MFRPSADTPNTASTALTTTTAPASRSPDADAADPVARGQLFEPASSGLPSEACKPAALPRDVLAKLSCEKNSDPGGPLSSTYTLVRDKAALGGTFELKQVRRRRDAS